MTKSILKLDTLLLMVKVIVNIITLLRLNKSPIYKEFVNEWFSRFRTAMIHRGLPYAIKRSKEERLLFLRYLSGAPMTQSNLIRVGIYKGLPKLKSLRKLDFCDLWDLRVITTVMSVSRVFTVKPKPDFSPLINPTAGTYKTVLESEVIKAIRTLVRNRADRKFDSSFKGFHSSNKTSPIGLPALMSSVYEAGIILNNYPDLINNLTTLVGSEFTGMLTSVGLNEKGLVSTFDTKSDIKAKYHSLIRRVTTIADKEGKTRIIAILDYWSQTALKPLHDHFLKILKTIPFDMTYDQSRIPYEKIEGKVFSFDLTNATDRFPISLQKEVLKYFIGRDKAEAWASLLTSLPFSYKGQKYSFTAGQPLGAYSSWTIFTFCHHIVVQIAISRAHCEANARDVYRILGDDILMWDPNVAREYRKIMKGLDVEISETKTFESTSFFEFAKRHFLRSNSVWAEITGFPIAGLLQSIKVPYLASQYFSGICKKGWLEIEHLLNTPDVYNSFRKAAGSPINNREKQDFLLSQYTVRNLEDAKRFSERFSGLNPYCNNKDRFVELIRDAFIVARMKVVNNELGKLEATEITDYLRALREKIKALPSNQTTGLATSATPGWYHFRHADASCRRPPGAVVLWLCHRGGRNRSPRVS
jgi:hypothetical protein